MPSRKDQLTGYMCLNRIETAESLCIVQPFSPHLFQQGELPGPSLFLKFWREELTSEQAYAAWKKERSKTRGITVHKRFLGGGAKHLVHGSGLLV